MGRILIKGGVWRNTEDEILKAAVMKYGKNQWSRIASLLHRKSAKQCKARWYEWLDPSIKKTEWSREEEEKLINLVRLMPNQWRTISSIVGRTATQCLEHYNQLLDQVQNKEKNLLDDPHKLKPGEIDPNPETKPARPDPKDMDEDELEMLSEARARLANTQGKKAKRKAREKQLEEARRLAQLQKRRELRMAGINLQIRNHKFKRFVDYNGEVPFEKQVPRGFHDTSQDNYEPGNHDFKKLRQQQLEGELYSEREERERKKDKQKLKRKKENGIPVALNATGPEFKRPRSKLVLPEPAISDKEIEQVVKLGKASELAKETAEESGNIASETLLADYSITTSVNSIRTPKTSAFSRDNIMAEAKNLLALQNVDTPLLGGQNTPLIELDLPGRIKTPGTSLAMVASSTPNTMITTPYRSVNQGSNATGSQWVNVNSEAVQTPGKSSLEGGFTPLTTPVRDKLAINLEEPLAIADPSQYSNKQYVKHVKETLRKAFSQLPQPKNEYEVVLDDENEINHKIDEQEQDPTVVDLDQSDIDAAEFDREHARVMREQKWTKAVRRDLPRPSDVRGALWFEQTLKSTSSSLMLEAENLIKDEMMKILHFDALLNPTDDQKLFSAVKSKNKSKSYETELASYLEQNPLEPIDEKDLKMAEHLLKQEMEAVCEAMQHDQSSSQPEEASRIWDECYSQLVYLTTQNRYTKANMVSKGERIKSLEERLEQNRVHMSRDAKKAGKIEKKLAVLLGGYQSRANDLLKQFRECGQQIEQSHLELHSFKALQVQENRAVDKRVEALERDVNTQNEREKLLQTRFEQLLRKKEEFEERLTSLREKTVEE